MWTEAKNRPVSPIFLCKNCYFIFLHYTRSDSIFIFLHSIVAKRRFFLTLCLRVFCVYLMKGYLENTEKDRIKRLIRLKPPTEFWMRNSEAVIIESLVWVVCWASCELEWHVTEARQTYRYDILSSNMVQVRILLGP